MLEILQIQHNEFVLLQIQHTNSYNNKFVCFQLYEFTINATKSYILDEFVLEILQVWLSNL